MNEDLAGSLLKSRSRLSVVHHVPGRLRLRFAPDILDAVPELESRLGEGALTAVEGVEDVRVNAFASSMVIVYDPDRIAPDDWETLIAGSDEQARAVIARLLGG